MSGRAGVGWWLLVGIAALLLLPSLGFIAIGVAELATSDQELNSRALDAYEGSAAFVYAAVLLGWVGISVAVAVYFCAPVRSVARAGFVVAVMFVVAVALQAGIHWGLMRRITALTGQGFGGFP